MKPYALLLPLLAAVHGLPGANPLARQLTWRGGETLPGHIIAADHATLTFHPVLESAPGLFTQAAVLRLEQLSELHLASPEKKPRSEAFEVRLNDGSRVLADVTGMQRDWLHLRSTWLGDFKLHRASVQSLTRVRGDDLVFNASGPQTQWTESLRLERGEAPFDDPFAAPGQAQARVWRVSRAARASDSETDEPQLWSRAAGGGFTTLSWSNTLSSPITTEPPALLRLDTRLGSRHRPQFSLRLYFPDIELRVETWEDRLVLRHGHRFATAPFRLPDKAADLEFTVLCNRDTGAAFLLDELGKELAALPAESAPAAPPVPPKRGPRRRPSEQPNSPTVALENLGLDLTLHALTLIRWNGRPPPARTPSENIGARLLDGSFIHGALTACDAQEATLTHIDKGTRQTIALDRILALRLAPTPPSSPASISAAGGVKPKSVRARLRSQHGEELTAAFTGITGAVPQEQSATLVHAAAASPLAARLMLTQTLVWLHPDDAPPDASPAPDRLRAGSQSIRGSIVPTGDPLPRWRFAGALDPVPLNPAQPVIIERDDNAFAARATEPDQVLLQLKSGDLLSARLRALYSGGLNISTPGMPALVSNLSSRDLDAVHFPGKPVIAQGFSDPDWRWLDGGENPPSLTDADGLRLEPDHLLSHPAMLDGGALEFTLHDESRLGMACLRLGLFTRPHDARGDHLKLLIAFVGDEIYCGDEAGEGQMRRQSQTPHAGGPARIQIRLHEQRMLVRVNDTQALSLDVTAAARPGAGLILQSTGLWGNQPQTLRVTDFSARQPLQRLRTAQVDEEARRQALTIPRHLLGDPPAHVLLAPTGDLLRGVIENISPREVTLRWGMETLRVPRQRLAAIVLLDAMDPPADTSAQPADPAPSPTRAASQASPPHWLLLADGSRLGCKLLAWQEDDIIGLHPRLGRVRLPAAEARAVWSQTPPPLPEAMKAMANWKPVPAALPDIPEALAAASDNVGKEAADFTLPLLDGAAFHLHGQRGRVVVLDFWATWCAPCIRALPELIEAMKDLPSDQVRLIGVNQGEPEEQVRRFLQARQWPLNTVLDRDQAVGRQYGVESIPHTVVITPDGRIALVKTGHTAETAREIAAKVSELLRAAQ